MTPAQVAHIMSMMEVYVNACFHLASGKWAADGSALRREHEAARAAVEAALRDAPQAEPVAIYHGRCTIDCGEHGHHDIELLKMVPKGARLYTSPSAPTEVEPTAADLVYQKYGISPEVQEALEKERLELLKAQGEGNA